MRSLSTRLSPDQTTPWRARLPAVAELVLVTLLALQAARLAWLALTPAGPIDTATVGPATAVAASPSLPRADVFFRSAITSSTASDKALGFTLFGVRSDGGHGSAILGKDGEQASYAVGREIATGIVLESVGTGHAVLLASGARHRLELPPLATAGAAPAATTLPAGNPTVAAPPAVPAVAAPPGATTTSPATPGQSPSPTDPAGSTGNGYVITPGVRAALLRPAGLRPGDVVLSVNGRPLDPARLAGLRNELKGQNQLTIQYRRDGQTHTTTVQAP
ncbi:type II secretion system protein N [Lysobacter sp. F6437]|uniref:type II secretion system protein N n=1 Tax=Lysobacter sp. F6437 TaxID=3459296 RepID=UPI00403D9964